MQPIKKLIWVYFWLLLFEGALRKWLLPSLDTPLLLIRDPVVVVIYVLAMQRGLFPASPLIMIGFVLVCLTGLASIAIGLPPLVALYGMRSNLLHVPLIFVIGRVFDSEDVQKMGRCILYIALPMAMLMMYQFRSPQDSLINKGAFATHYDSVRPSATFSFVTGAAAFLAMLGSFLAYGFLHRDRVPVWLLGIAAMGLLGSLAVSGSRLAVTSVVLVGLAAVAAVVIRGKGFSGIIIGGLVLGLAVAVLSMTSVFREGQSQLNQRFEDANPDQSSQTSFVTSRASGDLMIAYELLGRTPLFGHGTGLGTSVGAALAVGQRTFLGAEGEFGRLIWESGPVFGPLLIIYRFALAFTIGMAAYGALRQANFLPLMVFSGCVALIAQGQWGLTSVQGFACLGAGLSLAACRAPRRELIRQYLARRYQMMMSGHRALA